MSWLLFDLHGSVAAFCPAASTTLSDAYRYDGFGQQIASAGSVTNPWRYRGLLNLTQDFGSGALLAMNARDYAPQLGVFTQEDSVQGSAANPFTMNRFLYALANPATLIDPDGHRAILDEGDSYIPLPYDVPTWHPRQTNLDGDGNHESRDQETFDCGFERLACRSDGLARELGLYWGGVRSGWDFGAGIFGIPGALWDDQMCYMDRDCMLARLQAGKAEHDAFWADPFAGLRKMASDTAFGLADWIGQKHTAFTSGSGFQRAEAMGHFVGDVENTGLSTIYTVKSIATVIRGPSTAAILREHATAAGTAFDPATSFTTRQAAALAKRASLFDLFKGERVDKFFRDLVKADPRLQGKVTLTRRGAFGPDVRPASGSGWWDLTTTGAWQRHVNLYEPVFGPPTGMLTYQ